MSLADQVSELEQNVKKLRCQTAYWKVQYMFLKNICKQNNIDLKPYYEEAERNKPEE